MTVTNGLSWPLCRLGILTEPVARVWVNPLHVEPVFRLVAEPVMRFQWNIVGWGAAPLAMIGRCEIAGIHGAVSGISGAFLIVVALAIGRLLSSQPDPNVWAIRVLPFAFAVFGLVLLVVTLALLAANGAIVVTARSLARKLASLFGAAHALRGKPGAASSAVWMMSIWPGPITAKTGYILWRTIGRAIGMNADFGIHTGRLLVCDYNDYSTDMVS